MVREPLRGRAEGLERGEEEVAEGQRERLERTHGGEKRMSCEFRRESVLDTKEWR